MWGNSHGISAPVYPFWYVLIIGIAVMCFEDMKCQPRALDGPPEAFDGPQGSRRLFLRVDRVGRIVDAVPIDRIMR